MKKERKIICIIGPTASGKTGWGVSVARKFNGEIISADSRQVYRGLDIGTGKDLEDYSDVKYHLIDICEPGVYFTVFDWLERAREVIEDIFKNIENKNYLDPIAIEFMIGDLDLNIAGTFDRLYFNKKSNQYEIWDFKTDKKLDFQNKYQKLDLFDLDDCEFEKYSLQTSLYKYIIEKNTPIKLGTSHIVHFKFRDNSYDIIPCNDYTELIKEKLDNGNNWSTHK